MTRTIALGVALLATLITPITADEFELDKTHAAVVWKISHLGYSYTRGRFNDVSGGFNLDADPAKCSVKLTIKAESIDSNNEKRDQHLRGPDFFGVKQFPLISFESTSVKKGAKENTLEVTGKLTLHGVTKEVTVTATKMAEGKDPWGKYRAGFEIPLNIKRSDFGMKYMVDKIGDDVEINISIEGTKKG